MIRGYLGRSYTMEEIEGMSEEEKAQNNAFSNLGLNPSAEGETDPEAIAQKAPLYLSHILEQNYMRELCPPAFFRCQCRQRRNKQRVSELQQEAGIIFRQLHDLHRPWVTLSMGRLSS